MESESGNVIESVSSSSLETLSDTLGDLVTGLPAPVRRNAFKAFSELCTAAVDIPVAYLEGVAEERRAQTAARVKLISTSADQISGQMNVPLEYAHAAVKKFGHKIVQQQVNLDNVANAAAKVLQDETHDNNEVSEASISNDWLNNFQEEAKQVTSEEMRLLFGKVLAGEITRPSSYSIKTVRTLSQLDNQAAVIFRNLCAMCMYLKAGDYLIDARVASLGGNAASNALQAYGLSFASLNTLHEYGLIIADYNSYMDYQMCIATPQNVVSLGFTYQDKLYGLKAPEGRSPSTEFRVNGVALTRVGQELSRVVETIPNEDYTKALTQFFESQQFTVIEVRQPSVG